MEDAKRIIREKDFKHWIWKACNSNAYGAFLSIAMNGSIADAVRSCGIMLLITAGVQLSLAFNIALSVRVAAYLCIYLYMSR